MRPLLVVPGRIRTPFEKRLRLCSGSPASYHSVCLQRPTIRGRPESGVDLLPLTGSFFRADLGTNFNLTTVKRRVFDRTGGPEALKEMARTGGPVELSYAKGAIQETALELGRFAGAIDPGRIRKWRQWHRKMIKLRLPTPHWLTSSSRSEGYNESLEKLSWSAIY